jgi:hypothetical protein
MGTKPLNLAVANLNGTAQVMSPQALSNYLSQLSESDAKEAVAHIEASELSVMLGTQRMDDSLLKLLTDLWDSPDYHTTFTIGRGKEYIKNVCLNMIGGTTETWLKNSVPTESLEGGFFSRLLLVQRAPTGKKNAIPMMSERHHNALQKVIHDLGKIAMMSGEFVMTEKAQNMYKLWYVEMNHPEKAESFMRGYFGRKGDFIIKISMCLSAMFSNNMIITEDEIEYAIQILNENEEFTKGIVKYMGTTEDGGKLIYVRNKIRKSMVRATVTEDYEEDGKKKSRSVPKDTVGILHRDLMRSVQHKYKATELAEILDALVQTGDIESRTEGQSKVHIFKGGKE